MPRNVATPGRFPPGADASRRKAITLRFAKTAAERPTAVAEALLVGEQS